MVCTIKYFIVDSALHFLLWDFSKGMIDIKFTSNPIQAIIQDNEETVIKVPKARIFKNIILLMFIIKKKRIGTFINGV